MPAAAIVHLGLGGFARSHLAAYVDELADPAWGICGVGTREGDRRVVEALQRQGSYTLVLRHPDGSLQHRTVTSVREALLAPDDPDAVVARLADPATRIASLTITEGGWSLAGDTSAFDLLTRALDVRRREGRAPFTVMSCDNLQDNGHVASECVAGHAGGELGAWIRDHVRFPSSMVDRITPATTEVDRALVRDRWGLADDAPVVAEPFTQWVLEDAFSDGRPALERVGVQLVPDVRPYELVKLRLLNAGHQVIAHLGTLLGHVHVHEAVADPLVSGLLRAWFAEAVPTLQPVPGLDVDAYCATTLERFGNAHVADTLERLCAFTSDRIPGFVLPAARDNLAAGRPVEVAATACALWAHWLRARPVRVVDNVADPDVLALTGDLASAPAFREPYDRVLAALGAGGPRAI